MSVQPTGGGKSNAVLASLRCTYQVHELEALQQLAVLVFEAVGLVDDDATPLDGVKFRASSQDHLKRGDDGLELGSTSQNPTLETKRGEITSHQRWQHKDC